MEGSINGNIVTVQGTDNLVPAVIGGEQAGSRPSRSNDRNVAVVADLAIATAKATRKDEESAFIRSSKILRSPVLKTPTVSTDCIEGTPVKRNGEGNTIVPTPREDQNSNNQMSPREELISEERAAEERSLKQCREVIKKMRLALGKQKNISLDVKNGISKLDELLDVISNHRMSWKKAESEQKLQLKTKQKEKLTQKANDTPVTSKRSASSPAQIEITKKPKTNVSNNEWQTATQKKPKKSAQNAPKAGMTREKKPRTDALLIVPREGHTYAEVLQNLRSKIPPAEADAKIKAIRKTRNGALLMQLARGEKIGEKLSEAIKTTIVDSAEMRELKSRTTVEIRDLDSFTTCDEVTAAINGLLEKPSGDIKVNLSGPNNREQKRAIVTLSVEEAKTLLEKGKVRIGWVSCKIREFISIRKCFKCFRTGHLVYACKGPDRTNQCIKCGKSDHKIKECKNKPKCCLCAENGREDLEHIPGSQRCPESRITIR